MVLPRSFRNQLMSDIIVIANNLGEIVKPVGYC